MVGTGEGEVRSLKKMLIGDLQRDRKSTFCKRMQIIKRSANEPHLLYITEPTQYGNCVVLFPRC